MENQTHNVNGIVVPTIGGDGTASLTDYISRNAHPKVMKMIRRRDDMIEKVREEQHDRSNAGKHGLTGRQVNDN